ncbi:glycosyltransferase [Prescottella soli]|uniref:Glycosyltransferase n=1 Tax=Prescottella soli TaxID=1543852 RepID=A0ABW9FYR8_9NOCA
MSREPSFHDLAPSGARVLWVASSGGHLTELTRIARTTSADEQSDWVTFDTPQTRGALQGQRCHFVDYIAPRDLRRAVKASSWAIRHLRREKYDVCISTGAALAVSVLPVAAAYGCNAIYVESISRVDGPSLTGRILRATPRVRTYTQHAAWSSSSWKWSGSILDGWVAEPRARAKRSRRVFVTLGTIQPYRFDRIVDAVLSVIEPGDEVVWQLGSTVRADLPGKVLREVSQDEFRRLAAESDVTVTHAGVGSILELLDLGLVPVLAVRSSGFDEHVDDHQRQIADEMVRRGLAFELDLEAPSGETFERACSFEALAVGANDHRRSGTSAGHNTFRGE